MASSSSHSKALQKLLVTRSKDQVPKEAVQMLDDCGRFEISYWDGSGAMAREDLLNQIADKDALICLVQDRIDQELLARANKLKVIGSMAVGYDHLDIDAIKARGIKACNTPDVLTSDTAELTVALLLATSRRLLEANHELKSGGWGAWTPLWLCGIGLNGSTVGIVGLGRIGQAVHARLKPFGVRKFFYTGRNRRPEEEENGAEFVDLKTLLSESDFVIVLCELNKGTANLFNKTTFGMMKKDAIFVNAARGGIVNQPDLYEALTKGTIRAAGLDVMTPEPLPVNDPLTRLPNCVLVPHIGSATISTRVRMATLVAENIVAWAEGRPMPTQLC